MSTAATAVLVALAACSPAETVSGPGENEDSGNHPAFPGFDTSIYPGDAALDAWHWPHSPYRWVGYYLGGPCHRDQTWRGRRARLVSDGWGVAAIYVGQQDWSQIPDVVPTFARVDVIPSLEPDPAAAALATCSASLLTDAQGQAEGQDAIQRMVDDGFGIGGSVFLDVEYVTVVNDALLTYVRAWVRTLLADGRYRAGVYLSRSNAPAISGAARDEWTRGGGSGSPLFWIAASSSSLHFSIDSRPTDVGYDYASLWQGKLDVTETWSGVHLAIDVDVASAMSPSAPGALAQVAPLDPARTDP